MKLTVFTDGASRGNPGQASYGFVIRDHKGQVLYEEGKRLGITTNNVAEYTAVKESLRYIRESFFRDLSLKVQYFADSRLVVEQLSGRFKIKSPHLRILIDEIRNLEKKIGEVTYTHIRRELNKDADRLANLALDI